MEKEQDQKYQEKKQHGSKLDTGNVVGVNTAGLWKKNKIRNIRKRNNTGANCFRLISIRVRSRWIFRQFLFIGIKKWN